MNSSPSFFLRFAYTIFLGILLASFIGFGIAAFYNAPSYPEYSTYGLSKPVEEKSATVSAQEIEAQNQSEEDWRKYEKESKEYNKNVSIIALTFSIIVLFLGIIISNRLAVLADGVMLGSVILLIYGIIRGFESQDTMFRFIVVSVGLIIALILGFLKLVKTSSK